MVLKAQGPVYGGYVLHRSEKEGITFIKGAIPGETVEVAVEVKKRDYSVARVMEVVEPSSNRMEPTCQYFGECGGCHLQYVTYPRQVEMKNHVLLDCLRRLGGIEEVHLDPPLYGEPFGYRKRGQFKVSREGKIGLFREATREVVEIESCPLMSDGVNAALKSVRNVGAGDAREVHITEGDSTIILLKGIDYNEDLADALMDDGIDGVAFDNGSYRGSGPSYISYDLNGLDYSVSPWSFIQSNWDMNCRMVAHLVNEAGSMNDMTVLDLYAGAGNFSLPLAVDAKKVVAVEENPRAMDDAKRNASRNRITGYKCIRGTAETANVKGQFDLVLLDPPRPGLSRDAMRRVLNLEPHRIAYVSCNPSTLARDMKVLSEVYAIDSIGIVDMFPNTYHLECISFMTKK